MAHNRNLATYANLLITSQPSVQTYILKLREMLNSSDQSANLMIGAMIIDSGAIQHIFYQLDDLSSDITQNKLTIIYANSQTLWSTHVGSVNLTDELNLENVLCVPDLQHNFISVRALTKSRHHVIFENDGMVNINDINNNSTTKIGHVISDLFHL